MSVIKLSERSGLYLIPESDQTINKNKLEIIDKTITSAFSKKRKVEVERRRKWWRQNKNTS